MPTDTNSEKKNVCRFIPTRIKVQCRNEEPFMAGIQFRRGPVGPDGTVSAIPCIDCQHCGRVYSFDVATGKWLSDRPLVFLGEET